MSTPESIGNAAKAIETFHRVTSRNEQAQHLDRLIVSLGRLFGVDVRIVEQRAEVDAVSDAATFYEEI